MSKIEDRLANIELLLGLCSECGKIVKWWNKLGERRDSAIQECLRDGIDPYSGHARICKVKPVPPQDYYELIQKFL